MRIIPVKLRPDVATYLKHVSRRFRIRDTGFVEDLFLLIRTNGTRLPSLTDVDARVQVEAKRAKVSPMLLRASMRKRHQVLGAMLKTSIIQKAAKAPAHEYNPLTVLEQCLDLFRSVFSLVRESQCVTCQFFSNCEYGRQYGKAVRNITKVIDPDFTRKVHPECPLLPEIDGEYQMAASSEFFAQIDPNALKISGIPAGVVEKGIKEEQAAQAAGADVLNETADASPEPEALSGEGEDPDVVVDEADDETDYSGIINTAGKTATYSTSHVAGQLVNLNSKLIDSLTNANLAIYMIARRFGTILDTMKKDQYKPVQETTTHRKERKIKSVSEVAKVKLTEHLKDDDVFEQKLIKKELVRDEHQKPEDKKQLLYILLDTSFSMSSMSTRTSPHAPYITRGVLAAALTLALVRKVRKDEGIMFIRPFEGQPGPLVNARAVEEFEKMEKYVTLCSFDGGGTSLSNAITKACQDINGNVAQEISKAEILMITDACDVMDSTICASLRTQLGKIPLNILDVSGSNRQADLVALSDNYYAVEPETKNLADIVQLVGGSKSKK